MVKDSRLPVHDKSTITTGLLTAVLNLFISLKHFYTSGVGATLLLPRGLTNT